MSSEDPQSQQATPPAEPGLPQFTSPHRRQRSPLRNVLIIVAVVVALWLVSTVVRVLSDIGAQVERDRVTGQPEAAVIIRPSPDPRAPGGTFVARRDLQKDSK